MDMMVQRNLPTEILWWHLTPHEPDRAYRPALYRRFCICCRSLRGIGLAWAGPAGFAHQLAYLAALAAAELASAADAAACALRAPPRAADPPRH